MTITIPTARPINGAAPTAGRLQPTLFDGPGLGAPGFDTPVARAHRPPEVVDLASHQRVRQFALVTLEVMSGRRPVAQLARWTNDQVLTMLQLIARRPGIPRMQLASVHCQRPLPDTLEAVLRVRVHGRSIAMACQMKLQKRRWICTVWDYRPEDLRPLARAA